MAEKVTHTLKELREKAGIKQEDLAAKLEVRALTISLWERGARKPKWSHRKKLEKLFKVETGSIEFAKSEEKTETQEESK